MSIGCANNRTELSVRSMVADRSMNLGLPVRVYRPSDQNTCDVYLSDIPTDRLLNPDDTLGNITGNIIHLHIFLMPEAGETPIDSSACNITVRHLILAADQPAPNEAGASNAAAGLYAGGGFCLPSSDPGDSTFAGSVFDATLRLSRSNVGFADRFGAARMAGSFSAPRDDDMSRAISAKMEQLSRSMQDVKK